jgi:hypothetical protein
VRLSGDRYRGTSGGQSMPGYYLEVSAKIFIRSDTPADDIPGDVYSQIAEHVRSDEDIIDIEVNCMPVPEDLCGSTPH